MKKIISTYKILFLTILALLSISCGDKKEHRQISELEINMNSIAEEYVKLVLKVGQYDSLYVDAYYGPEEWIPSGKNLHLDSIAYKKLNSDIDIHSSGP